MRLLALGDRCLILLRSTAWRESDGSGIPIPGTTCRKTPISLTSYLSFNSEPSTDERAPACSISFARYSACIAPKGRLELPTCRLEVCRSIRLSYFGLWYLALAEHQVPGWLVSVLQGLHRGAFLGKEHLVDAPAFYGQDLTLPAVHLQTGYQET